jgi:sarcosine oxidase subunit gamma
MANMERISPLGAVGAPRSADTLYPAVSTRLEVDGASCELSERSFLSLLNIRGDGDLPGFPEAVYRCVELALPRIANTASVKEHKQLIWLGPDEWLYKTRPDRADFMGAGLRNALAGMHHSVVDVTSGSTTLVLKGEAAPLLLARGCPLDLHPKVFTAHKVAQSHVGKAAVTLLVLEAGTHFEITVRRSFAPYLRDWLCAAADQ